MALPLCSLSNYRKADWVNRARRRMRKRRGAMRWRQLPLFGCCYLKRICC